MHQVIEDRSRRNDPLVNGLFVPQKETRAVVAATVVPTSSSLATPTAAGDPVEVFGGIIQSLKGGYGFIRPNAGGGNVFFYYAHVNNLDFSELREGDNVRYRHGKTKKVPAQLILKS